MLFFQIINNSSPSLGLLTHFLRCFVYLEAGIICSTPVYYRSSYFQHMMFSLSFFYDLLRKRSYFSFNEIGTCQPTKSCTSTRLWYMSKKVVTKLKWILWSVCIFLQIVNLISDFLFLKLCNIVCFPDHKLCFVVGIASALLCVRIWPKTWNSTLFQFQSVLEISCFMWHLWVTHLPCFAFCPPFSSYYITLLSQKNELQWKR